MCDKQQTTPSAPDDDERDRPLTLAVLRQLVRHDWRALPGTTLVVPPTARSSRPAGPARPPTSASTCPSCACCAPPPSPPSSSA